MLAKRKLGALDDVCVVLQELEKCNLEVGIF